MFFSTSSSDIRPTGTVKWQSPIPQVKRRLVLFPDERTSRCLPCHADRQLIPFAFSIRRYVKRIEDILSVQLDWHPTPIIYSVRLSTISRSNAGLCSLFSRQSIQNLTHFLSVITESSPPLIGQVQHCMWFLANKFFFNDYVTSRLELVDM